MVIKNMVIQLESAGYENSAPAGRDFFWNLRKMWPEKFGKHGNMRRPEKKHGNKNMVI